MAGGRALQERRPLQQAVCILLEYILVVVVLGLHGGHVSTSVLAGQSVISQLHSRSHAGLQPREGSLGTRYLLLQRKAGMYIDWVFLTVFCVLIEVMALEWKQFWDQLNIFDVQSDYFSQNLKSFVILLP